MCMQEYMCTSLIAIASKIMDAEQAREKLKSKYIMKLRNQKEKCSLIFEVKR